MWDLEQGALFKTMEGHKGEVTGVALTESGDKAVSGSVDGTVKIWNTDLNSGFCGELIYTIDNKGISVCALVMVKEDSLFACGDQDGRLSFWNLISGELLHSISAHSGPVSSVAVVQGEKKDVRNSDSCPPQIISTSSSDEKVRMFDFNSGRLANSTDSKGSVSVVSATNHVFVSGTVAGSLSVWDVNGFSHKHLLASSSETSGAITALCLANNGRLVFSSDTEGKIKAWELFSLQSS
jgi:WD40 repeat protein